MFYFLSQFKDYFSGLNIFRYITFRAGLAAMTTFLFCLILGPIFIKRLKDFKIQEIAKRKDCPVLDAFTVGKEGTPTMGGLFIIGSILFAILLWGNLYNPFVLLTTFTCLWLAILGGIDDYVKLTCKVGRGLTKKRKLFWEIALGFLIGVYIYVTPETSTRLTFPFLKDLIVDLGILFIPFVILVVVGTSNAVNFTDGLDGLAIGCVLIVSMSLGVLSYIVGNARFSEYLFLHYVPQAAELTVICAAITGASLGFLWFNCHPATIFMGDVGSLSLGGVLGIIAILIKQEMLLVLLGGIFVIEALSVILQIISFRIWKKRIFKVSPFHHHLQLSGWNESKIIIRFWIIAIILALITLTTLKIR